MAEAKIRKERFLEFPLSKLEQMNGLAMDFGGSVCKIAYLSKEDWKDGKPVSGDLGKVRLISFAREEFDEGLEFLKTNCFLKRNSEDEKPLVYTCGIGGTQFGKKIEETLNIKTLNQNEMGCFKATLDYFLDNMPLEECCVPIPKEVTEKVKKEVLYTRKLFKEMKEKGLADLDVKENIDGIFKTEHDPFAKTKSFLLGTFGSAWGVVRFGEEGGQGLVNLSQFAGRSFLGLGSILTGAETYEELMELAEKGNNLNLDMTNKTVTQKTKDSKDEEDLYSAFRDMEPRPVFLWGLAVGKKGADFRKEDLARTLLYTMCQVLVATVIDACLITKTRHIFLGGGFLSHPLTQKLVIREFEYRRWQNAANLPDTDGDCHLHILKHGSHLGALGAFLRHVDKSLN